MAIYRTNRSRTTSFIGKFKFNYEILLGQIPGGESTGPGVDKGIVQAFPTNAFVNLGTSTGFNFSGIVANSVSPPDPTPGGNSYDRHPWNEYGGLAQFANLEYDSVAKTVKIPFSFSLSLQGQGQTSTTIYDKFILEVVNIDLAKDFKQVTGSIEGTVYFGAPLEEYVEINEFLPSEIQTKPSSSGCGDDEIVVLKDLDKDTVRQFPRYTTLNWFEMFKPNSFSQMGVEIVATDSKGKTNRFSRFERIIFSTARRVSYSASKILNAWAGNIDNNGYIAFYGSTPDTSDPLLAKTTRVTVDSNNFSIRHYTSPDGILYAIPNLTARVLFGGEPTRSVTFDANVYDWDKNHTNPLKAYLVGFGSDYKPKRYKRITYNEAQYLTVESNSGNISASQTYRKINISDVEAREGITGLPSEIDAKSLVFDNTQRWIYGMIDGIHSNEIFDDLESPTDNMDYPDKYIRGADGCENINFLNQELTIGEDELPSGNASIPIPLKGWKFNAMTLKQDKEYIIPGEGNTRYYIGDQGEPHYYGDQNLSGYRYLNLEVRSLNNDLQNSLINITETSKGFTKSNNSQIEDTKYWKIRSSTNKFQNIIVDLCNPDNKNDNVDNQDSPYPRLNAYTTSKPVSLSPLGLLAAENKPKDNFLFTGPIDGSESSVWITGEIKKRIQDSGVIYLTDPVSKNVDYFDVNTSAFPKSGLGTNYIFGRPRIANGKIKLAKPFIAADGYTYDENGKRIDIIPDYFKEIYFYKVQNDLNKDNTVDGFLLKDKDGKYPEEFEIYDYNPGYPDITGNLSKTTALFADGNQIIKVEHNAVFLNNPYDSLEIENSTLKIKKIYKIIQYVNSQAEETSYFTIEAPNDTNLNLQFPSGSSIKLTFSRSDDRFASIVLKFSSIDKVEENKYRGNIEYSKLDKNSEPNYDGIPPTINGVETVFNPNSPIITVRDPRLVEFTFPKNTILNTNILSKDPSENEVNAIDDYPEDEASNGPYYGVSRITKLQVDNDLLELKEVKLQRINSLSNFVYSGNNNTFESKTKFTVAENANTTEIPTETQYFTRRFWQQNTDGRDEEEGDIEWQLTKTSRLNNWQLFPKSISGLCDDINKIDEYVAPQWLNINNPSSKVVRHPGWVAQKILKSYPTDPITGDRIYTIDLDPEYLNSDTGYATWVYGSGILALPSGKNSGSGTSYVKAIDISFNELKTLLAQTIFHRINGNFPPGLPDLFGNTSLKNSDGTQQTSVLHLRGGIIARGLANGLILPPQMSTDDNIRKANLIEASTGAAAGSSESNDFGYYQTETPFGKNQIDHFVQLEKSKQFANPEAFKSSTRNLSQAKRERASFKGGKELATDITACESGFENSIVIAYTVPTTKEKDIKYTSIVQTDSFYSGVYENYCVGYPDVQSGNGVSLPGEYPFLLSSELIKNSRSVHTFLLTEDTSLLKSQSTNNYNSLISSNTNMRNKFSWYPHIFGESKSDANFSTNAIAFSKMRFNSYAISNESPLLANIGYADDGSVIFRTIPLNTSGTVAPVTDQNLLVAGKAPTYISEFRLLDTLMLEGIAAPVHPTISIVNSQEYLASYVLKENMRTINGKFISNYELSDKFELINLDDISGQTLSEESNIFGLTSVYDNRLNVQRNVFFSSGSIFYYEVPVSSSSFGTSVIPKLHLIAGNVNSDFAVNLIQRDSMVTYYDSNSELSNVVSKHKPAIISCKHTNYSSDVIVVYDTGNCNIRAVKFNPYSNTFNDITGIACTYVDYPIECVSSADVTTDSNSIKPQALFTANPTSGITDLFVVFTNDSFDFSGSDLTYEWDFGDGTSSTETNPTHTFVNSTNVDKEFTVTLLVTNSNGVKSNPTTLKITVNPKVTDLKPTAKFSASPTSGPATLSVLFTNQSLPVKDGSVISTYVWDFLGNGQLSSFSNNDDLIYDYTVSGTYKPTLYVEDNFSRKSDVFTGPNIVVSLTPKADFSWKQTSFGPVFNVKFTDKSTPVSIVTSWAWDFGDGQTSSSQSPEHFYDLPGVYDVKLTVTNSSNDTNSINYRVTVSGQGNDNPIANFSYSQVNKTYTVNFLDTTEGQIVSWKWIFDANDLTLTSNLQNPVYNYSTFGSYTVSLEVTDSFGNTDIEVKTITVSEITNQPPVISLINATQTSFEPINVKFTEESSDIDGYITKWEWNFGDGSDIYSTTSSLSKNPTHQYVSPGVYDVTLTVTDNGLFDGTNKKSSQKSLPIEVFAPPANKHPQASFVVDNNNNFAPLAVNFTDTSTDSDGFIVKWLWEFENNSFIEFNLQTYRKTVNYLFTKSGVYTVKLTVTDNNGLTNTATFDIIVNNSLPNSVFTISPNPINSKESANFDGSKSFDSDGAIVSYNWDFGDTTRQDNASSNVSHIYNRPGEYTITLEVIDNFGASNISQKNLTVNNRKPTARISYTSLVVKAPGSLSFSGQNSFDEDGNIVSYAWVVSNGQVSSLQNPTFQFTSEGSFTVTLTVTDDFGDSNSSQVVVNVSPADNILPNAVLLVDKNSGLVNDLFNFDVSSSKDPDGFITFYEIDFGDGNTTSFVSPANVSHIYTSVGIYNASLIVTDNRNGRSLPSNQQITIINQAPSANFSFNPANPQTIQTINFIDSSTDPENDLVRWEWSFGDGNSFITSDANKKSPQHQYAFGNKTYSVTLTVYDKFNLSNSITKNIFVSNRIPVAVISTNPADVNKVITGFAPFTVIFDSLAFDLDGSISDYEWTISGLQSAPITTKSFTYTFNTPRFVPYTVSHRVRDNDGFWSNTVTVAVKVNPPNEPPVARITANPVSNSSFAPIDVTFSGAGSYDPDNIGGPLAYYWDFGNGQTSFEQIAVTRYTQPGTYNVSLKVIDNQDGTSTQNLKYIVKNNQPIAVLNTVPPGITQVEIDTSVTFTSDGSNDPDINQFISGYKWLIDGVNQNSNTPEISYIFTSTGNHTVTLSVFDNFGLESTPVNKTIFVVRTPPPPPPNKNPIAVISNEPELSGNIELKSGDTYTFDGLLSYDPEDANNITFEWYLDGFLVGTTSQLSYTFNTVGLFTVSLVVADTQNLKSSVLTNLGRRLSVPVNVSAIPKVDANKLFTTGQAIDGAIASGAYEPNRYGYQLVDDTRKYVIIEAGLKHSFVVDDLGILYGSGDNTYGQLGLPSNISKVNVLTKIPLNSKFRIVKVSAGDTTSAIIVEDTVLNKKVLLVCGDNNLGTFGQALPKSNIYGFQSILERNLSNSPLNFSNNDALLDVSTCQHITAFADSKKVWVAGKHNYSSTGFVNEIGFIGIDVRQNPDLFLTTPIMPFKIEVGFFDPTSPNDFVGYVTGIAFDPDNQIVWFAGKTNLRGWGYAYDISTYENRIGVLLADTNPYFNRAIYFYGFTSTNEIPAFLISPGTAAESQNFLPGDPQAETFQKVSVSNFGYLALSENYYWPWGDNSNGELGFAINYKDTLSENAKNGRFPGDISSVPDIANPTDISAGGFHSLLIASSAKPSTYTFTFVRTGGYPNPEVLTAYPTEQSAQ